MLTLRLFAPVVNRARRTPGSLLDTARRGFPYIMLLPTLPPKFGLIIDIDRGQTHATAIPCESEYGLYVWGGYTRATMASTGRWKHSTG